MNGHHPVADSVSTVQKKILIIGGGTGLASTYLLEHMPNLEVVLAEASNRLGGHINSIDFGVHGMAEGGAEFIGSETSYPNVHQLFKQLGVRLNKYELNIEIRQMNQPTQHNSIIFPPIYHCTKKVDTSLSSRFFSWLAPAQNHYQKKTVFSSDTFFNRLTDFLTIDAVLAFAMHEKSPNESLELETLEAFLERFKLHSLHEDATGEQIDSFANRLLYPMVAGSWGIPLAEVKKMGAHYALNYFSLSKDWHDAPDGLSDYINKMRAACLSADIRLNTPVTKLVPCQTTDGQPVKYQALLKDGTFLLDTTTGQPAVFDDVIISTPAYAMADILPDIDSQALSELRDALKAVRYYNTTVAFHLDPRYQSPNNTVVHTRIDGELAANTIQKDWKAAEGEIAIMKTWVLPGQPMPDPDRTKATCYYHHPYMDEHFFKAQQMLRAMQTKYGLNFGSVLGGNGDSHEDAIMAAFQAAHAICTKYHCLDRNVKLMPLLNDNREVVVRNAQLTSSETAELPGPSI
ncbi:MAG: FAD-dependent oxidoreductase [Gammaproteobacteria bacterium]